MAAAEMNAREMIRSREDVFATVSGEILDGSEYAFEVVAMATVDRFRLHEERRLSEGKTCVGRDERGGGKCSGHVDVDADALCVTVAHVE